MLYHEGQKLTPEDVKSVDIKFEYNVWMNQFVAYSQNWDGMILGLGATEDDARIDALENLLDVALGE